MSIKGTKTEQNLLKSFAGESQARSRYTFFASVAKKEGYEQIAGVFMETAEQEKEHAKKFFKYLEGGMVEITAAYPAGIIATTAENLKAAAEGENEEWDQLYPEFARIADEEGFPQIANTFRQTLPHPPRPRRIRQILRTRRRNRMAMPQLRIRPQEQESPDEMPRMRTPAGILRAEKEQLLIGNDFTRKAGTGLPVPALLFRDKSPASQ